MMQERVSQTDNGFIVIRHVRETNQYVVEHGRSGLAGDLAASPPFATLDLAIAWVETLEKRRAASGGEIGDNRVENRKSLGGDGDVTVVAPRHEPVLDQE